MRAAPQGTVGERAPSASRAPSHQSFLSGSRNTSEVGRGPNEEEEDDEEEASRVASTQPGEGLGVLPGESVKAGALAGLLEPPLANQARMNGERDLSAVCQVLQHRENP